MSENEIDQEESESEIESVQESAEDTSPPAPAFDDTELIDIYASQLAAAIPTPCSLISGQAGTGKSFEVMRRIQEDPSYAILSASTGISAVNLNAVTINSLLGFFDYDSLRDAYLRRSAQRKLKEIVEEGFKNVVLDEISMVPHYTLDTIVDVFDDVNAELTGAEATPIGLIAVGDMAQLAPIADTKGKKRGERVPPPWAFDGRSWHRFEENTTQLTQNWRQLNSSSPTKEKFLSALSHARAGRGGACVGELERAGLEFQTYVDMEFDGTTILSENKHVDSFNLEAMKRVSGRDMFLPSRRWGKERGEWKNIPLQTQIRENAYVMILANQPGPTRGTYTFVNGDCGHVRGITQRFGNPLPYINVELVRTGEIVKVAPIVRGVEHRDKPDGFSAAEKVDDVYYPRPHFYRPGKRYVSGQVQYYPIRLAYATTAHKSQSLSLDRIQVDLRSWQFSNPGMSYVAMSRCRTLEGLRLVGQKEVVAEKCKSDPRVSRWL